MPPEILAYELRTCGQVVWGDRDVLALVPRFRAEDIPLEDAWRLLCNRMIELLEVAPLGELGQVTRNSEERGRASAALPSTAPSFVPYSAVKLYLDMATSFLLFQGAYEPTYRGREARLRILAEGATDRDRYPFLPLRHFSKRVTACTELKLGTSGLGGTSASLEAQTLCPLETEWACTSSVFWKQIASDARALWRWELARLTGCKVTTPCVKEATWGSPKETGTTSHTPTDRELMERWMRLQPLHKTLRGWASAVRRCGGHRSWRNWPHWIRLAWQASPRYWVYAAASELFFRLPDIVNGGDPIPNGDLDLRRIRSWLPVRRDLRGIHKNLSWRDVAADIGWNYHRSLYGTRS
jgi:hypothetical protein